MSRMLWGMRRDVPTGAKIYYRGQLAEWEWIKDVADLFKRRSQVAEIVGLDPTDTPCCECGGGTGLCSTAPVLCVSCAGRLKRRGGI